MLIKTYQLVIDSEVDEKRLHINFSLYINSAHYELNFILFLGE